eukprot:TRINITY_DN425_c0_g3_i1.p1 TRINITY_DN425_c0_g3~~TRINITY_DN425_c0_g3_i1.p1  ORF type:complete len:798 (+),score=344.73 TRINITY_DN425_c0_g3_i1:445-2838(+)
MTEAISEERVRRAADQLSRLQATWLAPAQPLTTLLERHVPRLLLLLAGSAPSAGLVAAASALPTGSKSVRHWFQHLAGPHFLHSKESGRRVAGLLLLAGSVSALPAPVWPDTVAPLTATLLDTLKRASEPDSVHAAAWKALAAVVVAASSSADTARDVGTPLASKCAPIAVRHLAADQPISVKVSAATAVCGLMAACRGAFKQQLTALLELAVASLLSHGSAAATGTATLSSPNATAFAELVACASAASGESAWRATQLGLLRGALAVVHAFAPSDSLPPPPPVVSSSAAAAGSSASASASELSLPALDEEDAAGLEPARAAQRFERLTMAVAACWAACGSAGWSVPVGATMAVVSASSGLSASVRASLASAAESEMAVERVQSGGVRLLRSMLLACRSALLPWAASVADSLLLLLSGSRLSRVLLFDVASVAVTALGNAWPAGAGGVHGGAASFVRVLLSEHLLPALLAAAPAPDPLATRPAASASSSSSSSSSTNKRRRVDDGVPASAATVDAAAAAVADASLELTAAAAADVAETLAAELPTLLEAPLRARLEAAAVSLLLVHLDNPPASVDASVGVGGRSQPSAYVLAASLVRLLGSSVLTSWPSRSAVMPHAVAICTRLRHHPASAVRSAARRTLATCCAVAPSHAAAPVPAAAAPTTTVQPQPAAAPTTTVQPQAAVSTSLAAASTPTTSSSSSRPTHSQPPAVPAAASVTALPPTGQLMVAAASSSLLAAPLLPVAAAAALTLAAADAQLSSPVPAAAASAVVGVGLVDADSALTLPDIIDEAADSEDDS